MKKQKQKKEDVIAKNNHDFEALKEKCMPNHASAK